ncbi:fibronectin type III domain-containing protein [Bacillus sp. JJ664]
MKRILSIVLITLLFLNILDLNSIKQVFASEVAVLVSNNDSTSVLTKDSGNNLYVNGNKVATEWKREYYFTVSGGYTSRDQSVSLNSSQLDLTDITYGKYTSNYTGQIKAFRIKLINPLYMYHFSQYQSGAYYDSTFYDCLGKRTPRYLDSTDPDRYIIINAETGEVEDFDSELNFYYCNNIENSSFVQETTIKNPALPVISEVPVLQDFNAKSNSIELNWNSVPYATSYEIEIDGQRIETSFTSNYTDGNLSSFSQHTYRVRAINENSVSGWSNSLTGTTLLDTPTNIVEQSTPDSITLNWDAVNSADKYEIKMDNLVYQTSSSVTNYTISGLGSGIKHSYQVRAINDHTQSEWTTLKDWYTLPKLPTNVTAIESNNNIKLTWSASTGATGYDISIDDTVVSTTNLSYTYSLSSKGPHSYKLRTKNSAGVGEWVIPNVSAASPIASNISIVNNKAGIDDVITVLGLVEDDIVKVYNAQTGGTLLGETVVSTGQTDTKIVISQLGAVSGNIYVSIQKPGTNESARITQSYLSETSPTLSPSNITVTNNYEGTNDTVTINGLLEGDTINLYNAATGGNQIGSGVVASGNNLLVIDIPQLGSTSGTVYVSVTKVNKLESARVAKGYSSEPTTTAPVASAITIINNKLGIDDKVIVTGLQENDVITIYNALTGGAIIGSGTVENGETTLNLSIPQLGAAGGTLYFTKKSEGKLESSRTAKGFESETSPILISSNITVVNNYVGTDDTVTVNGLSEGDVISIYTASTGGNLVGTDTVGAGNTTITISVPQLSSMAGTIYVSVTKVNKLESTRQSKTYTTEPTTTAPLTSSIAVTNNKAGIDDTVKISGLVEGDIVTVYNASTGGVVLGTATVEVLETSKTFVIPQLGSGAGNVYVTIKKDGKLESARTAQTYTSETSPTLSASNVTVVNNYVGTDDTITITGLVEGDIITVYDTLTNGNVISSGKVGAGNTSLTLSIPQLGSTSGTVYISVIKYNKLESARLSKAYLTEPTTTAPTASSISVVNNKVGIDDIVVITGLVEGDVVTVYSAATGGTVLGSSTVGAGETTKTFNITQLGTGSGNVYATIKKDGKLESARTAQTYTSETSSTLSSSNVTVVNNYIGTDDSITVNGLVEGDLVKVYDATTGGNLVVEGTVGVGSTSIKLSVPQLGSAAGTTYVSVTKVNKLESARLAKAYSSEPTTVAPIASSITVTNNKVGIDDTVVVAGLVEGDLVTIYSAATGSTVLGSSTVGAGETIKTFNIAQLGAGTGSVYVTIKQGGKLESTRTAKSYTSETSPTLSTSNVTIVNNYVGTDDTVTVSGLSAGDIITIYNATTGGNIIGTGTVDNGKTTITLSLPQLSSAAGTTYISITNVNKLESARLAKTYASEPTTTAPAAASIVVTNNKAGFDDTVVVSGLVQGDTVTVYSAATGGTVLGSAVVETGETSKTIMIPQLGTGTGSVYVTVKKDGKLESSRTAQTFTSETTAIISTSYITVLNNYVGTDDTVSVTNLAAGDIINVYDAATGGNLIGTGTVASGNTAVSISIPQIGSAAGTIYVTITNVNKLESSRMNKAFLVEPTTQQLSPTAISVTNNKVGTDDTIVVTGLVEGDFITIYNSTGTTVLGTGTVDAGQTAITITVPQLSTAAGSIQVSNKKIGKHESIRTSKSYVAE